MRELSATLLDSPAMSGYSDRGPPSENAFSLPPISLKLASSPSNTDLSSGDDLDTHLPGDMASSYSSRASTFMFSRRSSRLGSTSSSPTKLPVIDRSKSNSVTSLNGSLTSRRSKMRHSFREVRRDRAAVSDEADDDRAALSKSPSCPALPWQPQATSNSNVDSMKIESDHHTSLRGANGDLNASFHPATAKQCHGDSMHLPDIFSSSNSRNQKAKRDSSLPPLVNGTHAALKSELTPRGDKLQERGRKQRRSSLSGDVGYHTSHDDSSAVTPRTYSSAQAANSAAMGGGFLVPITESDKVTAKQKSNSGGGGRQRSKSKASPRHLRELNDVSTRHANVGIAGLLQIEGESVQNGNERLKWEIREEDEHMETESTCSYDETQAIDEIAKENNILSKKKSVHDSGGKSKKAR